MMELYFENELKVLGELKKSPIPLTSKVKLDEATTKINECFDFDFDGVSKFYPYELSDVLKDLDFNILCIVGASGRGKSTFAKYYGEDKNVIWDNDKCILSNFNSVDEGIEKLCAVGLNSIPTWAKPYNVLSVGERFRASLARKLSSNCVIDEFTSNVDRNVALSCSKSIGKYIRTHNLKKCVFVSCHKDFIDVLCPDYVVDLDEEKIYDTRDLPPRKFELSIYENTNKNEMWNIFKQHHYLNGEMNVASKCFVAYLGNELVACCYVLPQPGMIHNAFRIHRLVVLPDYQGLGIGTKLLEYVCDLYNYHNKTIYIRTSNYKLAKFMKNRKSEWVETARSGTQSPQTGVLWKVINGRIAYSFKYIGGSKGDYAYNKIYFPKKIESKNEYEIQTLF